MANAAGDVINSASVGINVYNQATAIPQISGVTSSTIAVTAYGTINSGTLLTGTSARPAGILAGYRGRHDQHGELRGVWQCHGR